MLPPRLAQRPASKLRPAAESGAPALRSWTGVLALLLLAGFFGSREPAFLTPANFFNILNSIAIIGLLALGQALPLIGGGFDLSQGAVASLTGVVAAGLMSRHGMPIPAAAAAGVGLGLLLGGLNGWLIARVRMNPFVATLGTQIAFFGLTNVYTNNQPISLGPNGAQFRQLAFGQPGRPDPSDEVGGLTWAALLLLFLAIALGVYLRRTRGGQHLYALGGSEEAARLAGIAVGRVKIAAYAFSGAMAAAGGLVMIARAGQASPVAGQGYELQSLASCIVGGVALGGGCGGAVHVLLGSLTLGAIDNGLQMAVNAPNWRPVIQGAIILLAVAVDARSRARR